MSIVYFLCWSHNPEHSTWFYQWLLSLPSTDLRISKLAANYRQLVKAKVTQLCLTLWLHGQYSPWNSPGQNTGVGSLSLLQGIFPTQGSSPGLPHCRQILYQLSHETLKMQFSGYHFEKFWFICSDMDLSGEYIISSVLSCHSKNLKQWTHQCYSPL